MLKKYISKSLTLCLYSVFFLVPLTFWLFTNESFDTPKATVFYVFTCLITCLFFAKAFLDGALKIKYTALSFPVLGLVLAYLLSFLMGLIINKTAAPIYWQFVKPIMAGALLYFIMVSAMPEASGWRLIFITLLSHFIVVIYGIFQYFGIDFIQWVSFGSGRIYSTLGNPDYMAAQFSLLIPLLIALLLSGLGKTKNFFLALFLAAMFFLIVVSHGRGAWLGVAGAVLYLFISFAFIYGKTFFFKYKTFFIALAIFLVSLFAILSFPNPLNKNAVSIGDRLKSGFNTSNDSAVVRLLYWESALEMVKQYPVFGIGAGGFSLNTAFYQKKVYDRWLKTAPAMAAKIQPHVELYTHNDFLQTLAETGLFGFGMFAWLFAAFIIMSFSSAQKETSILKKNIALGLSTAVVAFLVNGLLNFPWRVVPTQILMWTLISYFSLTEIKKEKTFKLHSPVLAFIMLPLAMGLASLQTGALYANILIKQGQTFFTQANYKGAIQSFEKGIKTFPRGTDLIELYLYAGNAYTSSTNLKAAIASYKKTLIIFPNFIEGHYNLGNVYMNNKLTDEAITEYEKVLALNPKFVAAVDHLATIYYTRGEFIKAKDMYLQILQVNPLLLEAHYNLGLVYTLLKDSKNAKTEFRKVLEINPAYTQARQRLKKLK